MAQYLSALTWAMLGIKGEMGVPVTSEQRLVTAGTTIIGLAVDGVIMGTITNLIFSMDSEEKRWQKDTEEISHYMRINGVPSDLLKRIQQYLEYVWTSSRAIVAEPPSRFSLLPPKMQTEVQIMLKKRVIDNIPFIQLCTTPSTQIALVQCLRDEIAMPEQIVCRQDDFGAQMFFLMRGELEVHMRIEITPGMDVVTTIDTIDEVGDFFGEMAMLDENSRRCASVVVIDSTFAELMKFEAEDFYRVVEHESGVREHLMRVMQERRENGQSKCEAVRVAHAQGDEQGPTAEFLELIHGAWDAVSGADDASDRPQSQRRPSHKTMVLRNHLNNMGEVSPAGLKTPTMASGRTLEISQMSEKSAKHSFSSSQVQPAP